MPFWEKFVSAKKLKELGATASDIEETENSFQEFEKELNNNLDGGKDRIGNKND